MTDDQADQLAARLKGFFSLITAEQGRDLAYRFFPKLDYRDASDAITAYVETRQVFNYAEFLSFARQYGGESAHERTQKMLNDERQEAKKVLDDRTRRDEQYARITAGMTGPEIKKIAEKATRKLGWNDQFRKRQLERGPAQSGLIRQLVCDHFNQAKGRKPR